MNHHVSKNVLVFLDFLIQLIHYSKMIECIAHSQFKGQQNYKIAPLIPVTSLPPPYPYMSPLPVTPVTPLTPGPGHSVTPDPDSVLSEYGRDTPDSSIKVTS